MLLPDKIDPRATVHKQVPVEIEGREVLVDEWVAPLVEWLNSIPGVTTVYSCQGFRAYDESGCWGGMAPYISLRVDSIDTLGKLYNLVGNDVPSSIPPTILVVDDAIVLRFERPEQLEFYVKCKFEGDR